MKENTHRKLAMVVARSIFTLSDCIFLTAKKFLKLMPLTLF
ncbi:hypothetical protein Xekj_00509 [Xenorhabdus sp. KJ12.1]|nr:hypothetical protein Xekj_00509 [Xenorhabdus sp. KJ12.1]